MTDRRAVASSPRPNLSESETLRVIEVIQAQARPEPLAIPKMISARSFANRIDVSTAWIRDFHRRGLLKGVVLRPDSGKGRGRLLFRESDVIEFLAARGIEAETEGNEK